MIMRNKKQLKSLDVTFDNLQLPLLKIHRKMQEAYKHMDLLDKQTEGSVKDDSQRNIWRMLHQCLGLLERMMLIYSILYKSKLKGPQDDLERKILYTEDCRESWMWHDAFYEKPLDSGVHILIYDKSKNTLVLRRSLANMLQDVDARCKVYWCCTPFFKEPPVFDWQVGRTQVPHYV